MIVCSGCGNSLEDDLRFCTECGTPNPTLQVGEPTVSLQTAPIVPDGPYHATKPKNPLTSPTTLADMGGSNEARASVTPIGIPPSQPSAPTANRTSLIIVGAVFAGLLLIFVGGLGARLLFSDNKPAEKSSGNSQTVTFGSDVAAPAQRTGAQPETQRQAQPQISSAPTPPAFNEATVRREVIDTINSWAAAARAHDLDGHMSYYADTLDSYYLRSNVSSDYVRASLAPAYARYTSLDIQVTNFSVVIDQSGTVATATFDKTYRFEGDKTLSGSVQELLTLTRINGRWLITRARDLKVYYTNK